MVEQVTEVPVLIAQTGKLQGSRWILDLESTLIGRAPDCGIVVPDRQVSRHHARVSRAEDGYVLQDMGSKNGTHVNGTPVVGERLLRDGDVIQISVAIKLIFIGTDVTVPLALGQEVSELVGQLRMDPDAHRVWVGGAEIDPPLSPPQYRLLDMLYRNAGRVVTRNEIVDEVWREALGEGVSEQAIDALVRRLRDRIGEIDPLHSYVVTVRGHGFRLENPQ
jgi:hypothetical protein